VLPKGALTVLSMQSGAVKREHSRCFPR